VVLALHHPPTATGLVAMDRMGLARGAEDLLTLLEQNPQVERVLCGHLHRGIVTVMGPAVVCVAPGTAHQIDLSTQEAAPLAWTMEPGGLLLHLAAPDAPMVTHHVLSGPFEGPFPYGD
jgi:3',5'-cyclic AMP phosphodiesterase CpdA